MRKLEVLRSLLGASQGLSQRECVPFSYLDQGLPRGALMQICGQGKRELVFEFLAQNPNLNIAWVEEKLTLFPPAILQRQVSLERILFNEAGREVSWVVLQLLRSQLFQFILAPHPKSLRSALTLR